MRRNAGRKPQTSANLAAFLHIIDCSGLLELLREDNRAIVRAASAASKAADYILGFLPNHTESEGAEPIDPEREAA